ncbi:MAG: TonB-dependent receptor, partial [Usitatibacteraceae bacterium]
FLKRASTLGETLNGQPGVSSTWFGPNASRPIIRGLDGDRIRILSNQGASFDASSVSPDHAVPLDPLIIERIEVLRGPASLLYGGAAVGGVVNVVDNRVPRAAVSGISGALEMRFGGAEKERGSSALLEAGAGAFSVHADGFSRDTGDYRVPDGTGVTSPIINSASSAKGGALGASYQFDKGYVGAAHSEYRSTYGTVAEATVRVDMKQRRDTVEANFSRLGGIVDGVFAKASQSDYEHTEKDDGVPQTTFKNKGEDFRLELKHAKLGNVQGVIGVQAERFEFSALGAEAFVPLTHTRNLAVFAFEELTTGPWVLSLGGRFEKSRAASDGTANTGAVRFGPAVTRTFNMGGASSGATYKINDQYSLTGNLSYTERAPTFYELYANGPHGATGAYEVGNPTFGKERSTGLEFALRWKQDLSSVRVGAFMQRFRDYLLLRRTGRDRDTEGNGDSAGVTNCGDDTSVESGCTAELLPEFRYESVSARLAGFEAEGKWRLIERPYTLDLETKFDFVRAEDRSNSSPLPRIAPMRFTGGLIWGMGPWGARLESQTFAKQKRFSFDDAGGTTSGYTFVNAAATYSFRLSNVGGTFFVRGTNLTNRIGFNAVSIDTIRNLAPLPGRGVKAGVQINF